jgi:hypothetical protein
VLKERRKIFLTSLIIVFIVFQDITRNSGLLQILQQRERFLCIFRHIPFYSDREELKRQMTDNLKVKASKAADDARVAAHAAYDDAAVAAHNTLKSAGDAMNKASDDAKTGVHKAVADAKIAAHEAGSKLKKR